MPVGWENTLSALCRGQGGGGPNMVKSLDSPSQKSPNPSRETIPACDAGGMGEHAVRSVPRAGRRRAQHGEEPGP
jgi:hypothetical protein